MTDPTREEFVKTRATGLGGSDIASALGIGDFACPRRTCFDKIGQEPDFRDDDKPEFRRGRRLEQVAADYYSEKTGRQLNKVERIVSKTHPNCAINADRLFFKEGADSPGYLEIKTVKSSFRIRKKGIYPAYLLQLQFGMAVAGWEYGAFAVYEPHGDELLHWDVDADKELGKSLLDKGQEWWNTHVVNKILPPPLAAESKPCVTCNYRVSCRAIDSDEIIL